MKKSEFTLAPEPFIMLSETINTLLSILGSSPCLSLMRMTLKLEPPKSSARMSLDSLPVGSCVT